MVLGVEIAMKGKTDSFALVWVLGILFAALGASRYPLGDWYFYPLFSIGIILLALGLLLQRNSDITDLN
ncbi:MAG: hypothetical protein EAX95_07065 [Candidatus Thorarchaeota archaeon]|nr:hypothetical protein [Candidatus Thorarchaeota archaeon]